MKVINFCMLILLLFSCQENTKENKKNTADLIISASLVYRVDSSFSTCEAVVVKAGKILDYGSLNDMQNLYQAREVIHADNQFVYPGFIDAHCHFLGYGLSLQQVDLSGTKSFDEVISKIIEFDSIYNPKWITGRGWDHSDWENNAFPDKTILDSLFPDKAVAVRRVDGHALLANQKALDLAGITVKSKFNGGTIVINNGELTGVLIDGPADYLLSTIPKADRIMKEKALLMAQENCLKVGLTSFHDAGLDKEDVLKIKEMCDNNELHFYANLILTDNEENFNYFLAKGPVMTEKVHINAFKFYGDGALGSWGACLLKPYSDVIEQLHYGKMLRPHSYYKKWAKELYEKGFQMCTHCIGDSANRAMLNIYTSVLPEDNDRRWRIEHAQVISPEDFEYFGTYKIIPSVQPTHATSDMKWAFKRLGRVRLKGAYAYKDLLHENGWLALGTDFPVEDISPIKTFYAAVVRKSLNKALTEAFQTENALSRDEALKGITIWAAKSGFMENKIGSIEKGKAANFTILDTDIMSCDEEIILSAKVQFTIIDGQAVYKN